MKPGKRLGVVWFALFLTLGVPIIWGIPIVRGDEAAAIQRALAQRVMDPQATLQELQLFAESRIRPLPEATSVEDWERQVAAIRQDVLEHVVFRGEAARWRDAACRVEWLDAIAGGPGYRIRKLRYEALPGLWIPALLYEPEKLTGKTPVVLNLNGHEHSDGKAVSYKQLRCINIAKRGMLALSPEWVGMGQLKSPAFDQYRMNQLDLCGTSGLAVHFLGMKRALDLLLDHEHADPERVAVAGLSGGGWQTIFLSSLDPRVTLANPVAGYSSYRTRVRHFSDLGDSEQTPVDLATFADYAHLTAMLAPRAALLTFNANDDCCFRADHAMRPLVDAALPFYRLYGQGDRLRWHVNQDPGTHNFGEDNRQQLYRMLGEHFFPGDASFDWKEIPSPGEVKSLEDLHVPLPEVNASFQSLAERLSRDLPRDGMLPTNLEQARQWQLARRDPLRKILRLKRHDVRATPGTPLDFPYGTATARQLKLGEDWTVPVTEFVPNEEPRSTVIVLADGGREYAAETVRLLLNDENRVLVMDPFYFGESSISQPDFLLALLVSAVGERPLGVQSGQVLSVAGWAKQRDGVPMRCVAVGSRTSLIALAAAAADPEMFEQIELHHSLGSLKEVLERNDVVSQGPERFCFGLLERFDILQLAAMTTPCRVVFPHPSERVQRELAVLAAWQELHGGEEKK